MYEVKTPRETYQIEAENSNKMRKAVFERENISYQKVEPVLDDSIYHQLSARYKGMKLGNSNTSMQIYGCALMCFSYVKRMDPLEVNKLFIEKGVYVNGDLINFAKACEVLGLKNYRRDDNINNMPSQEETIKQVYLGRSYHFVVRFNKDGKRSIFDPWTGDEQVINYYKFKSYRVFNK